MKKIVAALALTLSLSCLLLTPALASATTPSLQSLAKSVATLQKQVKSLKTQLATAKRVLALAPYVRVTRSTLAGVKGPNIVFRGANVHVCSASSEADSSGTGNLIIGWDEAPSPLPSPYRSGCNNLVVGSANNFTGYGSLVAGVRNTVAGAYPSVSGGSDGTASNYAASVSGGHFNTASGAYGSVSGGAGNTASYDVSSVSGGQSNTASGVVSTIGGGFNNTASGVMSTIGGGTENEAVSFGATIAGGSDITLNSATQYAWQAGPSYLWQ